MFDLGWSELLVVAVVLIVIVGPKDLPAMLRTFGRVTKQLRGMAGDFRRQFDEALKEADLEDVKHSVNEVRGLDPRRKVREAMNPMKSIGDEIRSSLNSATAAPEPKVPDKTGQPKAASDSDMEAAPKKDSDDVASSTASQDSPAKAKDVA